jgi:DNA-binding response OmpR family regulator
MQIPAKILITDDDAGIREMVRVTVEKAGYRTLQAQNGAEALRIVREQALDLLIMDVNMPELDGLETIRAIRQFSDLPIILLTVLSDEEHVVTGFQAGAYDYLTKPFRPRELLARVDALLRRSAMQTRPASSANLTYADLELDQRAQQVLKNGRPVETTAMGYQILEYFMRRPGQLISKEDLLRDVWDQPVGGHNMVEAAIKRLRRELDDDPREPRYIKTIWGAGYRFGD